MQARKTLLKKISTALLWIGVSIIVFLIVYHNHHHWQSLFFDYLGPRQQKLAITGDMVTILSPMLAIVFGVLTQVLINKVLKPAPHQTSMLDSPLSPITTEKILDIYSGENWRNITWINRGVIDTSYLQHHPFLVIHGQMKSGKTREAAELIRCVVKDGIVPPSQVFDLTGALRRFTPEEISSRLSQELRCEMRTLFFLNEIPADATEKHLQALDEFLTALKICSPGYFVTTVRTEHINHNPQLQKWLVQNDIHFVPLRQLNLKEMNDLIDELRMTCSFPWNENFRQEFVENCNGTPYHLILTFQRLNRSGSQVNREEISQIASQSLKDIWADIRREMEKTEPAAASLFKALAVCHLANITPRTPLVFALAAWMERKKMLLGLSWKIQERLILVAGMLKFYGVGYKERFTFPDVAIESLVISSEKSRSDLYSYLLTKKNGVDISIRLKTLSELVNSYFFMNDIEKAIDILKFIVEIDPKDARSWYNLGVLIYEKQCVNQAKDAYQNAVMADPQYGKAWSNLAGIIGELGQYEEAEKVFFKGLSIAPQLTNIWSGLGLIFRKQNKYEQAKKVLTVAFQYEPKVASHHSSLGAVYKKLGLIAESKQEFKFAQQFADSESLYNRACIAALVDDTPQAFSLLKNALDNQKVTRDWVRHDPDWDDLRQDPRYLDLVENEPASET